MQLHAARSMCLLAGPHRTVSFEQWQLCVRGAASGHAKARRLLKQDSSNCDTLRRGWIVEPPVWLQQLLQASALRDEAKQSSTLLERAHGSVQRLSRPSGEQISSKTPSTDVNVHLRGGVYGKVERKQQAERFRKLDPNHLDLAKVGDKLLDPLDFVAYPYNLLFSEPYLERCMVDCPPKIKGHRSLNTAPGITKGKLIDALKHMLYFSDDPAFLEAPTNGLFALLKSLDDNGEERHRLVFDGVHGNKFFSMEKFQALYEELVAADPERAAKIGCGAKIMNICGPSDFTDLPPGILSRSSSDLANFFFQFCQLQCLLRYQGLFNVPGADVGRPDVPAVRVGLRVLGMGSWISALAAHTVHWCVLHRGLVDSPLRVARPSFASAAHKADYAVAAAAAAEQPDGRVPWTLIPARMRARFLTVLPEGKGTGSPRLRELRVPLDALACEPLTSVASLPPEHWFRLSTALIGGSRNGRADVLAMRRRNEKERVDEFMGVCSVYCDDMHTLLYGPKEVGRGEFADQVAATHRLATVLVTDIAGLRQNFTKLKWPNRDTEPLLGIETEFLAGDDLLVRFSMGSARRMRIYNEIMEIVRLCRAGAKSVCEDQLQALVGDLVWCFMVKRPLLSGIQIIFRALHSKNRPPGQVWATPAFVDELEMVAGLLAFAETTTSEFTDTLWTFDASGSSKLGNGGEGVAYRRGVTQEIATELTTPFGRSKLSEFRIDTTGAPPQERLQSTRCASARRAAHFMRFSYKPGRSDWKIAREGEFRSPPRIVLKAESMAGSKAYLCASRRKQDRGKIVALLGDNTGSLHGLAKGRSGVRDLNAIYRRQAAVQIFRDVEARWGWINSLANPADYPSRMWIKRRLRECIDLRHAFRPTSAEAHMFPYPRPRGGGDPRTKSEWIRDIVAENGEAKNPGPYAPMVEQQLRVEARAREVAGPRALQIPDESTPEPYKGILPAKADLEPSLVGSSVQASTLRRYVKAFSGFCYFVRQKWFTRDKYSDLLADYVELTFAEGWATKTTSKQLLSFTAMVVDGAKATNARAYKAIDGWDKHQPPKPHPPLPWILALVFSWELLNSATHEDVDTGLALLLAHHVYTRGAELDGIRLKHLVDKHDVKAISADTQLIIEKTKAGRPQAVSVDDPFIESVLDFAIARAKRRARFLQLDEPHCPLFDFGKRGFLKRFQEAQVRVGYPEPFFVRHSSRHGGSTNDFMTRTRSEMEISTRLRHADPKTSKGYLQDNAVLQIMNDIPQIVVNKVEELGGALGIIGLISKKLQLPKHNTELLHRPTQNADARKKIKKAHPPTPAELREFIELCNLKLRQVEIAPFMDGHGVFATRGLKVGEVIGEYRGENIPEEERRRRYPNNDAQYLLGPVEPEDAPTFYIDAGSIKHSTWTRFINASALDAEPNVAFCQGPSEDGLHRRIWVTVIAEVRTGQQLRVDYGDTFRILGGCY